MLKDPRARAWLKILAVFAFFSLVAVITTWPLCAHLSTHLLGRSDDTPLHYWNGWWVQQALRSGQFVYYTPYLFYPQGVSLVTHNIAWINALAWAALEPALGGITAYNLALLLNLALCGCAMYALAKWLTGRWDAALVAGLIYQAWPCRVGQLGHPNLVSTQCIPLFALFMLSTLRTGRKRDAIWAGLWFALAGYTRWQQMIPAALLGLLIVAISYDQWLPKTARPRLARLLLAALVAVGLLIPPVVLLVSQQTGANAANLLREGEEDWVQTDLAAWLTPSERHWALHDQTKALYDRYYHDRLDHRYPAYLGITALALAFVGFRRSPRRNLVWLLYGGLLMALAAGALLRINGRFYPQVPMPYNLLARTFVIRLMRAPDRFNMFLALPIAALAAQGMAALLARVRQRGVATLGWSALAAALVLAEYLAVPIPLRAIGEPSVFYQRMAQDPEPYAVLNLPFDPLKAKQYMFDQVTHQHRIVQGNLSRVPGNAYDFINSLPLLRSLNSSQEVAPELLDVTEQLRSLDREDIRYIILHKNLVGADRVAHWKRYLVITPIYENQEIAVYSTGPIYERDFELEAEMVSGFGPASIWMPNQIACAGEVWEVDVAWGNALPIWERYQTALRLEDEQGRLWQEALCAVYPESSGDYRPPNSLVWAYYSLRLRADLPPGVYWVRASVQQTGTPGEMGVSAPLGKLTIVAHPGADANACGFPTFGEGLRLLNVTMQQNEGSLDCALVWRTDQRLPMDYKVFVHVFDLTTGVPVAQDDAMPRRGVYPTRLWWPGEKVDDRFVISLQGVASGEYGIAVGVYDPTTGERLPAHDAQGEPLADGRLVLPGRVRLP